MTHALQWLRSLIFEINMYGSMPVFGIVFLPWALISRKGAIAACKSWTHYNLWCARCLVGIRYEVRGTPPADQVMIAAKHQSFLDIIMIFISIPAGKYIMKRELMYAPVIGQYALKLGCVPVNRGKRSQAIKKMVEDVEKGAQEPGQLIIYPQGTRIAPGVKAPYKVGTGVLYEELGQDCVPVATNVGLFWGRRGIMKRPGLAVVEFLPRIEAGLERNAFMETLEQVVEEASDRLMEEAGMGADGLDRQH
ncbi:MAG: lysophospholipid acyltransferase family protein [Pseudomonadota bacterium]